MLAVVMLIAGFAFKIAAVPLHFYAGDVYQGAATPVTALLVVRPQDQRLRRADQDPATSSAAARWVVPPQIGKLLWIIAVLTMTVGNVLGLLQHNVKRVLAYSSVAHSGYMLVGIATLMAVAPIASLDCSSDALAGRAVLSRGVRHHERRRVRRADAAARRVTTPTSRAHATSAETFEDIAGQGRNHIGARPGDGGRCFSLIGLPLTVGFFGKLYLIRPRFACDRLLAGRHHDDQCRDLRGVLPADRRRRCSCVRLGRCPVRRDARGCPARPCDGGKFPSHHCDRPVRRRNLAPGHRSPADRNAAHHSAGSKSGGTEERPHPG